jgi:hypothetical protein
VVAAGVVLALMGLLAAGCGSSPSATRSSAADSAAGGAVDLGDTGSAQSPRAAKAAAPQESQAQQRAVVSTGHIALVSSDVGATRGRIDDLLLRVDGRVADEDTTTDRHGTVTRSHLVIRVPSDHFDRAMTDLGAVARLRSSSRQAEDVTTRVIDLGARVAAERAGVRRLRHLVSHTASLPALLAVERALTQRQGELESLRQQQAYLADQTSLATITVDVTHLVAPAPAVTKTTGGFVGGLRHGWHGLTAVVVALLLALGALLPFAAAGAVIGLPAWFLVRRVLRARRPRAPAES